MVNTPLSALPSGQAITPASGTISADSMIIGDNDPQNARFHRPIVSFGNSKTFALSDADTLQFSQSGGPVTCTVDTNANVPFPIGTEIQIFQAGSGQVTIAGGSGVSFITIAGYQKLGGGSGALVLLKSYSPDVWMLNGDLVP